MVKIPTVFTFPILDKYSKWWWNGPEWTSTWRHQVSLGLLQLRTQNLFTFFFFPPFSSWTQAKTNVRTDPKTAFSCFFFCFFFLNKTTWNSPSRSVFKIKSFISIVFFFFLLDTPLKGSGLGIGNRFPSDAKLYQRFNPWTFIRCSRLINAGLSCVYKKKTKQKNQNNTPISRIIGVSTES